MATENEMPVCSKDTQNLSQEQSLQVAFAVDFLKLLLEQPV